MKRIIYQQINGITAIVVPSPDYLDHLQTHGMTDDEALEYIAIKDVPLGLTWKIVNTDNLPTDRTYRNAWECDFNEGQKPIKHNMDKAKAIHVDRIRASRQPKLESLDIELMKAIGKNDSAKIAEIETARQKLRDLPETIDLSTATTIEGLKNIWPPELA
jgi:hypothetical protein